MRSLAGNKFWIVKHEMQVIDKSLTEDINLTFFFFFIIIQLFAHLLAGVDPCSWVWKPLVIVLTSSENSKPESNKESRLEHSCLLFFFHHRLRFCLKASKWKAATDQPKPFCRPLSSVQLFHILSTSHSDQMKTRFQRTNFPNLFPRPLSRQVSTRFKIKWNQKWSQACTALSTVA